ncbi:MAG: hypothetical protein HQL93_05630, partial [Magnetococcales bacterium]|nr:hypothetical protein [Magnetococcales bacterium]
ANKLIQQVMDRWIQDHSMQPGLKHQTRLRVIHEAQLARLTEFANGLRGISGVKNPQVLSSSARESVYEFEYHGRDEVLQEALRKLAAHMESTPEGLTLWLFAPKNPAAPAPKEANSPAPVAADPPKSWL